MAPVIRIDDATFDRLSTLKTWYRTKTPSETLDRVVREAFEQLGLEREDEPTGAGFNADKGLNPFDVAPPLTFTKPLSAEINGEKLLNPSWNALLLKVIAEVKAKGLEGEVLAQELAIGARTDVYENEGFRFHPDLAISIQGQSAGDCWKEADRLAKKWRIPVSVEFLWRDNPKAQYPGKTSLLRSGIS